MHRIILVTLGAVLLLVALTALYFSAKTFSAKAKLQVVQPSGRYQIRVSPSADGDAQIVLIDTISADCWACRGPNQWLYIGSPLFQEGNGGGGKGSEASDRGGE